MHEVVLRDLVLVDWQAENLTHDGAIALGQIRGTLYAQVGNHKAARPWLGCLLLLLLLLLLPGALLLWMAFTDDDPLQLRDRVAFLRADACVDVAAEDDGGGYGSGSGGGSA